MLALGGFRIGTLVKLEYRHIKRDIERGTLPIHVHVEAEITKGKYHDYDTFIGQEAADYLRAYLESRRKGSHRGRTPPENIRDDSPLIRDGHSRHTRPITTARALREPHRTVIDRSTLENHQLNQLTSALKQQILKEIQENNPKNSIKSSSGLSSPGEIRTLVNGSKGHYAWPLHHRASAQDCSRCALKF
jgi:hypothetical protein